MTNTSKRDLRIDLIRGIALLILFSDHVRGNIVARYTPIAIGLSDMSDVFIFLSGFSCGLSYGRRFHNQGFLACVKRAWSRAGQIYFVKLLVTIFALTTIHVSGDLATPYFFGNPWSMKLVRQYPFETLLECEMFRLELFQFFVLALYIPFLLVLPVVVFGLARSPMLICMASASIYLCSQIFPETVTLPDPWRGAVFFNPFAWQFLFVTACGLGMMSDERRAKLRPGNLIVFIAAIIVIVAVAIHCRWGIPRSPLIDKRNLGILRLLHFMAVVAIGSRLMPASSTLRRFTVICPLAICGSYPLVGYCAGGMLAILAEIALSAFSSEWPCQLMVNVLGWAGCLATTAIWKYCLIKPRTCTVLR